MNVTSVLRLDLIADAYATAPDNARHESASMDHCIEDLLARHLLDVAARDAQHHAFEKSLADREAPADEMIQWNALGREVAALVRVGERNPVVALDRAGVSLSNRVTCRPS
ncbi:MAG: hypothetical protein M5U30_19040 [Burkholderiaceae bacterium]|nr:hypothetical protein [Burkholderiaceae bacterium]